ncbi:MAG TPA: hypothetical protein VGS07_27915 [Thermoanaerobaculia bacterium]|jgi:hypothetical protein|nr:hypothetical protein [Thermoanaerobaculia bacterium]
MKVSKALIRSAVGAALILAVIGGSPLLAAEAAQDVIHQGVDLWMTVAGFAKTSFAQEPIPAGFFCADSKPFTGTVVFKGSPLAMTPARSLGSIDTVVRRLDDAVFNEKGEATTRIKLLALSLLSTQPIETSCGKYDVSVNLAGPQPTTTMKILRTEALGGTYSAPLALNVKAVFIPVNGDKSGKRELTRRIDLGPGSKSVWTYVNTPQYKAGVMVDTDGDGKPDTVLPGSSNFLAGVESAVLKNPPAKPMFADLPTGDPPCCPTPLCPYPSCHCDPDSTDPYNSSTGCDHLHCIWTCVQYPDRACACLAGPPPP